MEISQEELKIIEDITVFFEKLAKGKNYIVLPEELLAKMTEQHALIIRDYLHTVQMIKLPKSEIQFFEWLKENDPDVWKDLWELDNDNISDINSENSYLISKTFLPALLRKDGRGFPICDLVNVDNYYFSLHQLPDDESKIFIESAKERFINRDNLTISQLLALEISMGAIDIWHFAYKHKIDLNQAKKAVSDMVDDGVLVHLTESEHLIPFLHLD